MLIMVLGQNNSPECNGSFLAKHGIITVAMNYRVNIFGFIAMKELEDENGKSGNYGYYDQQAAIAWVQHNIQSFGGDVNNMTLIGQSAGATSCETQIKSPLNKGIFKQAIIQSSAGLANQRHIVHNTAKALDVVPHPGNGRLLVIVAIVTALFHPVIHGNGYDSVLGQE